MTLRPLLALAALLAMAGVAAAQEPPKVRPFPLATVEKLGAAMARQDAAAWVATDALRPRIPDFATAHLKGWIVEDAAAGQRVRFLRDDGHGLEAGWDIDVSDDLKTVVSEPADRTLTAEEKANFAAWNTAAATLRGQPVCRPGYNHIVLRDPERDGWLVWLMAPMPQLNTIPFGGHYRVSVSADGKTVTDRDALTAGCLVMDGREAPAGSKPVAVFVTSIVSPTPMETHVFLQLQSRQTVMVGAGDHVWAIEGGHIRDMGLMKDLAAKAQKAP